MIVILILGEFNDEYLFSVFKTLKLTDIEKELNSDSELFVISR